MAASPHAIGIDVGATKVAAGLVDTSGRVRERIQEPLTSQGGVAAVRQVVRLAERLALRTAPVGIGVAVPAVVDGLGREVVWAPNIRGWRHVGLADAVEQQLRVPVRLEYDGHAAVLGEQWIGAGRGIARMVMLVVGTGIGGGMVLDGRLYRGADGLAGAAGWLTSGACRVEPRQATLELAAAGPALARRGRAVDGRAESVFAAEVAGDAEARQTIDATADRLGMAVADIVSLLNPDLVVLGGGMCSGVASTRLLPRIRQVVRKCSQPFAARRVRVVCSRLGVDAGLIGAARAVFVESDVVDRSPQGEER